jgi:hypothetical protein
VSVAPSALWQSSVSRLRFATIPLMFNLSHCATLAGIGYNVSLQLLAHQRRRTASAQRPVRAQQSSWRPVLAVCLGLQ